MRRLLITTGLLFATGMAAAANSQPVIDLRQGMNTIEDRMSLDTDGDGYTTMAGDCDDNDAATYPGASEIADGVDNNCDGLIDKYR